MTESEILKLKEFCEKKTCATWYAYRDGDGYGPGATVRGPFFRWLRVEPGNDQSDQFPQNKGLLADDFDDAQYAAARSAAIPALLKERDEMREALHRIEQGPPIPMYGETPTPKQIATYVAQWSQDEARKALKKACAK